MLARSEGGMGVGLFIAKGVVEMHGGKIVARSKGAGQGSEFEIVLPLLKEVESRLHRAEPVSPSKRSEDRRVLLVEDNADTGVTLQMLLELEGPQVSSACDGLSGLSLAMSEPYDLVICDIGLPGLNGYGVISQLRQRRDMQQPFAIALSGYGQPEDRARHQCRF